MILTVLAFFDDTSRLPLGGGLPSSTRTSFLHPNSLSVDCFRITMSKRKKTNDDPEENDDSDMVRFLATNAL